MFKYEILDKMVERTMTVLSDREIREHVKKTKLIEPFDETLLAPASYDLRVGQKILKSRAAEEGTPIINLETEKILQIGTAEFVEILTLEKVNMPNDLCGRMGIRSYYTRKGLVSFVGPQIDPGFKGNLIISLFNTGPRPVVLKYGEPFCTVEFSKLNIPSEKAYSGEYQGQSDFPSENIEFILGEQGITLSEVVEVMKSLRSDMKWMKWLLALIFATLVGLLITRAL